MCYRWSFSLGTKFAVRPEHHFSPFFALCPFVHGLDHGSPLSAFSSLRAKRTAPAQPPGPARAPRAAPPRRPRRYKPRLRAADGLSRKKVCAVRWARGRAPALIPRLTSSPPPRREQSSMAALQQIAALAAPRVLEEAELAPGVSVITQAGAATLYAPLGLVAAVAGGRASRFLNRLAASVAAAHPARVVLSAALVKPGGAPARSATLFDEDGLQAVLHALDVPSLPAGARARLRAVADALPGLALAAPAAVAPAAAAPPEVEDEDMPVRSLQRTPAQH